MCATRTNLHDVLHTLVALPEDLDRTDLGRSALESGFQIGSDRWTVFFEQLVRQGRAGVGVWAEAQTASGQPARLRRYWVAAERARSFRSLFSEASFERELAEVEIR